MTAQTHPDDPKLKPVPRDEAAADHAHTAATHAEHHGHATHHARREEPRRLYRSRTDQMLGGVAGGMAEYFGIDPTLMRLIFIALVLLPGIGIIAYIIAWIVIPEEPAPAGHHAAKDSSVGEAATVTNDAPARADSTGEGSRRALGLILVAIGAFFLIRPYIDFSQFIQFWPLLLVFVGLAIIFGRGRT